MRAREFLGVAMGSALVAGVVGGVGLPVTSAHGRHAAAGLRAHAGVRDRSAVVLADALRASLFGKNARIVSMRKSLRGSQSGYLVTWAKGHRESKLFVNGRTGETTEVGQPVTAQDVTSTSTSLSSFLAALQADIETLAGEPVSAQTEDNGTVTVFTVTISGQTVTVSVATSATSTTTPPSTTLQPPPISMEAAASAALSTVAALGIPTLTNPFAVSATLVGWDGLPAGGQPGSGQQGQQGWPQGQQGGGQGWHQHGSQASSPNGASSAGGGTGSSSSTAAAYEIVVESAAGGAAVVLESADGVASTSGGAASPELLGIHTLASGGLSAPGMPGMPIEQGPMTAPAVTLDTAVTSAMATDQQGVPVHASLSDQGGTEEWDVSLVNPGNAETMIAIDATSGAVVSSPQSSSGG